MTSGLTAEFRPGLGVPCPPELCCLGRKPEGRVVCVPEARNGAVEEVTLLSLSQQSRKDIAKCGLY